jgi:nitroreductase
MNVLEAIRLRRSVRAYASTPIPDEVMERMHQALRFAPSACNFQPWRFIFVTEAELRHKIARAANEQLFIADAPLIVVGCGLPDQAYTGMGGRGNSVEIDVAIALDHLTLAAVAEDLGTCWIGAFDEQQVRRLLEVPPNAKVVAMTPLGYPASTDMIAPVRNDDRKNPSEIFATDRF